MKHKSVVLEGFQLAGHFASAVVRNPIKAINNIAAGVAEAPHFTAEKLGPAIMGAAGIAMLGLGIVNRDLMLSGIGLTFASAAGGAYEYHGEEIRTAARAKTLEAEREKPLAPEAVSEVEDDEPTPAEAADILAPSETRGTGLGKRVGFRPNLPRPGSPTP